MRRVRGVVYGQAAGLTAPRMRVRFVREATLVSAATVLLPVHRSLEGTRTERGVGLREPAQAAIGGEVLPFSGPNETVRYS
jgi:hypothetical protein